MISTFIAERCSDLPVAVCCRVMRVSTSGFYQWRASRSATPSSPRPIGLTSCRHLDDESAHLRHAAGRAPSCASGAGGHLADHHGRAPDGHLRGRSGIHYRRRGGCTRPGDGALSDDLVNRAFDPDGPDRLWCTDITEHPTAEGKVYLAVVLDACSRRVVGWSIADHMRAELVADALQMATWRRRPPAVRPMVHSDHGAPIHVAGLFGTASAPPACSARWAPSATASTVMMLVGSLRSGLTLAFD